MTREEIIEARRVKFEATWPMPADCMRCGNGYAATSYNAFAAHKFIERWKGYMEALDSLVIELPPKISENNKTAGGLVYPEAASYDEAIDDCREEIESQGIKVKP